MNAKDFLFLDKMITPTIITILYWILAVLVVAGGIITMVSGSFIQGLLIIPAGLVGVRLWAELTILAFKMYDCMKKIADNVDKVNVTKE